MTPPPSADRLLCYDDTMLKKAIAYLLAMILAVTMVSCQTTSEPYSTDTASVSATQWLELIDSGNYKKSWETASTLFKTQITVDEWISAAITARSPLGEVVSRKLTSQLYQTTLPGAPDGEYMVMEFRTAFTNKQSAIETITPMLETDGIWRVAGYYIR